MPSPGPDVRDTMMSQSKHIPYGAHSLVGTENPVDRWKSPTMICSENALLGNWT